MKKIFFISIFFLTAIKCFAQLEHASFDLLKVPSSPGFILLNKQPSDIERPVTPTDFIVSLKNSSDNFSVLPKNYALEIAPFWIWGARNISYKDAYGPRSYRSFAKNFKQSLMLSVAFAGDDDNGLKNQQIGTGIKFSIIRGKVNPRFTSNMDTLKSELKRIGQSLTNRAEAKLQMNIIYQSLKKQLADSNSNIELTIKQMEEIENKIKNEIISEIATEEEEKLKHFNEIQFSRIGWFLDIAGGTAINFPNMVFDSAEVYKAGAWLTGGYEFQQLSVLAVGRFLSNYNVPYKLANDSIKISESQTLDGGLRIVFDNGSFYGSVEGLYRLDRNINAQPFNWKAALNLGYDIGNNKIISLNITRDFDRTINKGGTLITALNLIVGFGSIRNLN